MRRHEFLICMVVAFFMLTAGLVWLFGPYGLLGPATALALIVLFVVDVKE